jgi:hypothetical protein
MRNAFESRYEHAGCAAVLESNCGLEKVDEHI